MQLYIYGHLSISIYIYIYRERERDAYIYIYVYIYIHVSPAVVKNTPPKKKTPGRIHTGFQSTKSGDGEQFLLLDCRAKIRAKADVCSQTQVCLAILCTAEVYAQRCLCVCSSAAVLSNGHVRMLAFSLDTYFKVSSSLQVKVCLFARAGIECIYVKRMKCGKYDVLRRSIPAHLHIHPPNLPAYLPTCLSPFLPSY